jgi:hypothetical protein
MPFHIEPKSLLPWRHVIEAVSMKSTTGQMAELKVAIPFDYLRRYPDSHFVAVFSRPAYQHSLIPQFYLAQRLFPQASPSLALLCPEARNSAYFFN